MIWEDIGRNGETGDYTGFLFDFVNICKKL